MSDNNRILESVLLSPLKVRAKEARGKLRKQSFAGLQLGRKYTAKWCQRLWSGDKNVDDFLFVSLFYSFSIMWFCDFYSLPLFCPHLSTLQRNLELCCFQGKKETKV